MNRVDPDMPLTSRWLRPVDYFVPAHLLAEPGDLRTRARILAAICLAGGILTAFAAVIDRLTSGVASGAVYTNLIGGSTIFLGAFLLRRTGSLTATANILLAVGWGMNVMLYLASGGTNLSSLYAFAMLPVIAFLIGGSRTGFFWTLTSSATAVLLILSPSVPAAVIDNFVITDQRTQIARDVVVITVWLALIGALFDGVRGAAQRDAEQALARAADSERRFAVAFEANPDGIVVADAETREILECNDGFLAILGRPREQVVGRLDWTVALGLDEGQREGVDKALRESGRCGEIDTQLTDRPAGNLTLRAHAGRVEIEGRPCVLATVRDVTTHARLEAQLRQSQKMEAVGQLAGSIAHDFNNMLTVISGYAEHLSSELSGELADMSKEIHGAAERSAELTRQLLAFSRRQVLEPQILDLNDMLRRLEKLLERLIGTTVEIRLDLARDLGHVRADPGQIEQVIVNLAINARDAMPDGGVLFVETQPFHGRPGDSAEPGDWVCLRVRDTGCGMDEPTLARVFEPFFTTKEQGKGTGLGLSTVEGIVSQSGGHIGIRSHPGQGTVVEIHLPRREDGPEQAHEAPALAAGAEGESQPTLATLLLVEDDDMVRRLASRSLRGAGYEVVEASDGEQALEIFTERGDGIDLVLTDMVMPRRGGVELARMLRGIRPDLPLVFMSGYPNPRESDSMAMPQGEELIQKPFSPAALRTRVAEVLQRHGGA